MCLCALWNLLNVVWSDSKSFVYTRKAGAAFNSVSSHLSPPFATWGPGWICYKPDWFMVIDSQEDNWRSLIQPLAQSKLSYEFRPGFSRPVSSFSIKRLRDLSGEPVLLLDCPQGEKVSPHILGWTFLFQVPVLPPTPLWRASICRLVNLIGSLRLQFGPLKALPSPHWTSHLLQPPHGANNPTPATTFQWLEC